MASPTNVIVELFNNRSISSIDQILGLLRPNTPVSLADEIGFNPALDYPALAARWMLHLKCYLSGTSVPRGPDHTSLFDEEENQDPLFRSKPFLRCMTGSSFFIAGR